MTEVENKALARRFLEEVVNTGAVERLGEFLSPDYTAHQGQIMGIKGAKEHIEIFHHCYLGAALKIGPKTAL